MFGRRRSHLAHWERRGYEDGRAEQAAVELRTRGSRPGEDTEPVDLAPDERAAYRAGRQRSGSGA